MTSSVKQINDLNDRSGLIPTVYFDSRFITIITQTGSESSTITFSKSKIVPIPDGIKSAISKISTFKDLPENWNSYGAKRPSEKSIRNSIEFLLRLARKQRTPSLIIPTPDEAIVIELEEAGVRLEFLFLPDNKSEISGYIHNELKFDHPLNETTESCSLKWLFCPDGNCNNW